jgi:hypothetical protein
LTCSFVTIVWSARWSPDCIPFLKAFGFQLVNRNYLLLLQGRHQSNMRACVGSASKHSRLQHFIAARIDENTVIFIAKLHAIMPFLPVFGALAHCNAKKAKDSFPSLAF